MTKKDEFLELLYLNDNLEIRNWLINNGKSSKPYAAVMFEKKTDNESVKDRDNDS